MPRDGAGVYSRPTGIDAVSGATIESTKYNLNVQDVETDLNVARPISAGGTGATTAAGALTALGGELAAQLVTNYDTFAFLAGSFYSAAGATAAPTADAAQGICYANAAGTDFYLEARSQLTNVKYVRRKTAGSWGAWTTDIASDPSKVAKAGDTMTGALTLPGNPANPLEAAPKQYVDSKAGIITLTGDVTASGVGSVPATLATVNGNVGVFGSVSAIPVVTVNAKGLVTAASTVAVTSVAITSLTGDVTAAGPGAAATTLATVNSNVGSFGSASAVPVITVNAKGLVTAVTTAAAAGTRVLLNTLTASNSATLTDTTSLTATYEHYEIIFENLIPSTAGSTSSFQMKVRSGGSIQGGAGAYHNTLVGNALTNQALNSAAAGALLGMTWPQISNVAADGGANGFIRVNNPSGTTSYKHWSGILTFAGTGTFGVVTFSGAWRGGTGAIDGVEFSMNAGNITSGKIKIYGWN